MNRETTTPISKLCKLALAFALLLCVVPALSRDRAAAADPCDPFPHVCRYKFDPIEHCCIADPRFDCYDVCF